MNINDSNIRPNLTFRNLVRLHMQQLTNFPYIEQDFDALTDYELLCLVVKYLNDVIANSNEQNTSITNLYNAFLQLQTYMNNSVQELEDEWNNKTTELENTWADKTTELENTWADKTTELETSFNNLQTWINNYFDNLDVQDEINNKLDEMLRDGVLEQIIEQFIQSAAVWCFNTVADMKAATNLTNGSYARTLGYYSINDGGGSLYKIVNTESQSDHQETLNSGLYATLIVENETINIKQLGAYGDGTHDDTSYVTLLTKYKNVHIPDGTYNISDDVNFNNINIKGENNSIINVVNVPSGTEHMIVFDGTNYVEDITFKQTTTDVMKLVKLQNNENTIFKNCKFIALEVECGAPLDIYTNNKNIIIEDCHFDLDSSVNGTNKEGGVWIRENNSQTTSKNIIFNNCFFSHKSSDEVIAVWDWFGHVENVKLNSCIFEEKTGNSGAHFITFDAKNSSMNNCIINALELHSRSSLIWSYNLNEVHINDCIFNTDATFINSIIKNPKAYVNNCSFNNERKTLFNQIAEINNSTINTHQFEIRECALKNSKINNIGYAGNKCVSNNTYLQNVDIYGLTWENGGNAFISCDDSDSTINITYDNVKAYGDLTNCQYWFLSNRSSATIKLKLINSFIKGGIYSTSTMTQGIVANNFSDRNYSDITITGVTFSNNVDIDYFG